MKKILPFLLGLFLLGQAGADKSPANLSGLKATDICSVNATFLNDGVTNSSIETTLTKTLREQDLLFGLKLTDANNILNCSHGVLFAVETFETENGSYIYTYDFVVYAHNGSSLTKSGSNKITSFAIYDLSGFGITYSLTRLQDNMTQKAKEIFQAFVLDWRKSH